MKEKIPDKKVILVFGIVFIIVVSYSFLNEKSIFNITKKSNNNLVVNSFIKSLSEKDTDGDGLKDWEENLLKTDFEKIDTDGDGTSDGDEIKQGRNPLDNSSNDFFAEKESFTKEETNPSKELTETETLTKNFLSEYMIFKGRGYSTETKEQFLERLIKERQESFESEEKNIYFLEDLNIIKNSDKESLEKYRQEILTILKENSDIEDDIIVLDNYFKNGEKDEDLKPFDNSIETYQNLKKEMLEVGVPSIFSEEHLQAVNLIERVIENTTDFKMVKTDPLKALFSSNEYLDNVQEIIDIFVEISQYIEKI